MALQLKDVAEELSDIQWKDVKCMAVHLNQMSWATLENIESSSSVDDERVNRTIHTWMSRDVDASWGQLVSALRKVKQNAIAEKIRARYCPNMPADTQPAVETVSAASNDTVSSPSESSADKSRALPSVDVSLPSTSQPLSVVPFNPPNHRPSHSFHVLLEQTSSNEPPQSVPPSAVAVQPRGSMQSFGAGVEISDARLRQVEEENCHLKVCFADLRTDTHVYMTERESSSTGFLKMFRITIWGIPEYEQGHSESERAYYNRLFIAFDSVLKAEDVSAIFRIIRPYYDYKNYDLLEFIINKFGDVQLKERMGGYVFELKTFEMKTTIKEFVAATTESTEIPMFFKSVTIKINKDASVCTLYDVRKFTKSLAKKASLTPYALMLQHVGINTVVVQLGLPRRALADLWLAFDEGFQETHCIVTVVINGNRLEVHVHVRYFL